MLFSLSDVCKNRIEYYIHRDLSIETIRNIEKCEIFVVKKIRRNLKKYDQHIAFHERFDSKFLIDAFVIKKLKNYFLNRS